MKGKAIFGCLTTVVAITLGVSSLAVAAAPGDPAGPKVLQPGQKAIPEELTADLNVSFYSKYVWRGLELSKDSLVIFPTMTVGYKGFALNLWADLDTSYHNAPAGEEKQFTLQETDLTLTYSNSLKKLLLDYTLGWIYYDTDGFHGDRPTTNQEVFVTLALNVPLKPTLSVYNEVQTGESRYVLLAIGHRFSVLQNWALDLGASGSYLYNKREDFSALHDGNLWASLTVPFGDHFSVTPKLQYSFPLSSDASDRIEANCFGDQHDSFVYGGVIFDLKM